jgi:hypothetical protein
MVSTYFVFSPSTFLFVQLSCFFVFQEQASFVNYASDRQIASLKAQQSQSSHITVHGRAWKLWGKRWLATLGIAYVCWCVHEVYFFLVASYHIPDPHIYHSINMIVCIASRPPSPWVRHCFIVWLTSWLMSK